MLTAYCSISIIRIASDMILVKLSASNQWRKCFSKNGKILSSDTRPSLCCKWYIQAQIEHVDLRLML
jgi:hypothetical protein